MAFSVVDDRSALSERAFHILIHFFAVLVLTATWNDQILGYAEDAFSISIQTSTLFIPILFLECWYTLSMPNDLEESRNPLQQLTIIRRRRSDYRWIFTETKSRWIFTDNHWAWYMYIQVIISKKRNTYRWLFQKRGKKKHFNAKIIYTYSGKTTDNPRTRAKRNGN